MSIPYHIGTGYFGGFLPLVSQYVVARTGDPSAGSWYTFGVVAMALVVTIFGLSETRGRALDAACEGRYPAAMILLPAPLRLRLDTAALVSTWNWLNQRSGNAACGAPITLGRPSGRESGCHVV